MRYSKNAEFNGRCVRLVLLPDGTEVLYINNRGEFNIEPVGAPSYAQALQMAKRRAEKEGVVLEVLGQQPECWMAIKGFQNENKKEHSKNIDDKIICRSSCF